MYANGLMEGGADDAQADPFRGLERVAEEVARIAADPEARSSQRRQRPAPAHGAPASRRSAAVAPSGQLGSTTSSERRGGRNKTAGFTRCCST